MRPRLLNKREASKDFAEKSFEAFHFYVFFCRPRRQSQAPRRLRVVRGEEAAA
jgi:hypothetical protein